MVQLPLLIPVLKHSTKTFLHLYQKISKTIALQKIKDLLVKKNKNIHFNSEQIMGKISKTIIKNNLLESKIILDKSKLLVLTINIKLMELSGEKKLINLQKINKN